MVRKTRQRLYAGTMQHSYRNRRFQTPQEPRTQVNTANSESPDSGFFPDPPELERCGACRQQLPADHPSHLLWHRDQKPYRGPIDRAWASETGTGKSYACHGCRTFRPDLAYINLSDGEYCDSALCSDCLKELIALAEKAASR
jgi:hypothetical protein